MYISILPQIFTIHFDMLSPPLPLFRYAIKSFLNSVYYIIIVLKRLNFRSVPFLTNAFVLTLISI